MFVFFCRLADALLSSEPGGGQGNLATHTVAQDYIFCLLFFLMHVILFSLCYAFSARHSPPLAGLWVVPPLRFVLVFAFCLAPPTTMVVCGKVLTLVSVVLAPVFSLIRLSSSRPLRHVDGTLEGFDGGLSCHSDFFGGLSCHRAFFGGLSCHSAFFVSPPRHTGGTRQVFEG